MIEWKKWDTDIVKKQHGDLYYYRDLYDGKHAQIFPRAMDLIKKGDIVDVITNGEVEAANVQTPYIVANVAKLIPEIPATLIAGSIGPLKSSLRNDDGLNETVEDETDELIEGIGEDGHNGEIVDLQGELLRQIELNSNLAYEHWGNIVQQQVDGGLVGVPWNDERGLRIDFKARDVYYPHEDGRGADLVFHRTISEESFLHVYREREEEGGLRATHHLYLLNDANEADEVDPELAREILGIKKMETVYKGRQRRFITYWANDKTFMNPLGVSCLKNQEGKQDEINWTLTRNALTFERNGKPRIAVSPEIFDALTQRAQERYGDGARIDHRDLEITTFDENGKSLEIIQIDISKIGDVQWVQDLMKMMFMETRTSEKAVDFYLEGGNSGRAQSGVAKFYDLFVSLVKAEQIRREYVHFLKELTANALWLAAQDDSNVRVEEPEITLSDMIPVSRGETVTENITAYSNGAQSLKQTVRRLNPQASDEWVEEEIAQIEEDQTPDDTGSLLRGRSTLLNLMDNRDPAGNPVEESEVDGDENTQ